MGQIKSYPFNISAPNLINICIDEDENPEWRGRLYHCYRVQPIFFSNVVELIKEAEKLFDRIGFPQASTRTRYFAEKEELPKKMLSKVREQKDLAHFYGKVGTFIVHVRYRQNSTWQGEVFWKEKEEKRSFSNMLVFLREIDAAVEGTE